MKPYFQGMGEVANQHQGMGPSNYMNLLLDAPFEGTQRNVNKYPPFYSHDLQRSSRAKMKLHF
jgi:hypothetical protein